MAFSKERVSLGVVKQMVEGYVGKRVILKTNKGRKRSKEREGVLEKTYPHLFIVRLDKSERHISFTYSDVLANLVEITLS